MTHFKGRPDTDDVVIFESLLECVRQLCCEIYAASFSLETAKTNTIGNKLYPAVGMELNTDFNFYSWDLQ